MRCQFICDDCKLFTFSGCLNDHPFLIVKLLELTQDSPIGWFHVVSSLLRLSGSRKEGWLSSSCTKLDHRCSEMWFPRWVIRGISSSSLTSSEVQGWNMDYPCSSRSLKVPPEVPPISVFPIKIWNCNTCTYIHTFHILHISPDGTHRTR